MSFMFKMMKNKKADATANQPKATDGLPQAVQRALKWDYLRSQPFVMKDAGFEPKVSVDEGTRAVKIEFFMDKKALPPGWNETMAVEVLSSVMDRPIRQLGYELNFAVNTLVE